MEVCESDNMESRVLAEEQLNSADNEFKEDLALMLGKESGSEDDMFDKEAKSLKKRARETNIKTPNKKLKKSVEQDSESEDENLNDSGEDDLSFDEESQSEDMSLKNGTRGTKMKKQEKKLKEPIEQDIESGDEDLNDSLDGSEDEMDEESQSEIENIETNDSSETETENQKLDTETEKELDQTKTNQLDGTWEDIYGRLRGKHGEVITPGSKYIPPAIRSKLDESEDKKKSQILDRLKKQLKGLLNRLAESNMHSIATQIEELYMKNSRNDMNQTLTNLINEALITDISTPERLLMEHVMLIAILHANIGTEVGNYEIALKTFHFDALTF